MSKEEEKALLVAAAAHNDRRLWRAEDSLNELAQLAGLDEARGPIFKIKDDPRCTRLGKVLRRFSLDELLQLFNVLRGDMSLVGPRPSMPYEVDMYKPWHFRRLEVLPGITGLAQVNGRSDLTFKDIAKIDIDYIERRSLLSDLKILLKTVPVVLSAHGAR